MGIGFYPSLTRIHWHASFFVTIKSGFCPDHHGPFYPLVSLLWLLADISCHNHLSFLEAL